MKRINILAAAILTASSANAAFDEGSAILYAYDPSDHDTYFVDLGVTGQDLINGASAEITDAGLAVFLASNAGAQWSILGTVANAGIIGTSRAGESSATTGLALYMQINALNSWIADIQVASGGRSSFSIEGSNSASMDGARSTEYFNGHLLNISEGLDHKLWHVQANPSGELSEP